MDTFNLSILIVILMVGLFDFTNGFHDAADMVATAIASHLMSPALAISIVSIFTFIAPFVVGLTVADTVGTFINIRGTSQHTAQSVVIGALLAAICFNLATWWLGYPSSSSNSLAGGLVGAGLYAVGTEKINWGINSLTSGHLEGLMKVVVGLFASPFMGFLIGFFVMKAFIALFKRLTIKANKWLKYSQYFSIAWLGFSHGANDAQKGMAIIGMMLLASGKNQLFDIPTWAIFWCASAITLGTLFDGWRIIKTLGYKLFRVTPVHSVANQIGAAIVNTLATSIGAPTSTTQVVTATLLGNGAAKKPLHVKWKTALGILSVWWVNIPATIILGWLFCFIYNSLWS
ncbi:MAG: phosphate transporter [Piscirickettsiaceae bacterium]|nr:MAG: phosphate transporter [Piscirickettsiaceae bacterium]